MTKNPVRRVTLLALSIAAFALPLAAHAVSFTPANPLAGGVVVGSLGEQVLCEPTCNAGFSLSLTDVGVVDGTAGNALEAGFGADGTASISFATGPVIVQDNPPFSSFSRTGTVSAMGSVRAAYQIEYVLAGAPSGATQSIHMTAGDTLSASGPILVSSRLTVIDAAYGSLTPPVLTPPSPNGPPSGPPNGPPPPPSATVYDDAHCLGGPVLGCFGGQPLAGADISILVNEPYDVIMTVSLGLPNETGQTVSGSASIDPGFAPVNPAPGGTFFISPSAVPEPSAWLLMVAGFGVVGVATRRRASVLV